MKSKIANKKIKMQKDENIINPETLYNEMKIL